MRMPETPILDTKFLARTTHEVCFPRSPKRNTSCPPPPPYTHDTEQQAFNTVYNWYRQRLPEKDTNKQISREEAIVLAKEAIRKLSNILEQLEHIPYDPDKPILKDDPMLFWMQLYQNARLQDDKKTHLYYRDLLLLVRIRLYRLRGRCKQDTFRRRSRFAKFLHYGGRE